MPLIYMYRRFLQAGVENYGLSPFWPHCVGLSPFARQHASQLPIAWDKIWTLSIYNKLENIRIVVVRHSAFTHLQQVLLFLLVLVFDPVGWIYIMQSYNLVYRQNMYIISLLVFEILLLNELQAFSNQMNCLLNNRVIKHLIEKN